jgi:hypothetical protein
MSFTSYDSVIAAIGAGRDEKAEFSKASLTTTAGRFYSLWKATGTPAAGSTPATGAGAAPDRSTGGAIKFTNPSGSNKKHLLRFGLGGASAAVFKLVDRLVHTSGLSGTSTSAQTINSTALTRRTDGVGVQAAIEVYSQLGGTSVTATISYTNQDGTASRSGTCTIPTTALAGEFIPFDLQSGDTGVRSIQTLTLSASTGTAGDFGVTLYYELATMASNANFYEERDMVLQLSNMPELKSGSCLALVALALTTSIGDKFGVIGMAEG